jgi:flagellar motor protein MotB
VDSPLKIIFLVGLLAAVTARAAGPVPVDQARADLDRQLQAMVDSPPPAVDLLFEGLQQEGYKLVEARFTLDGEALTVPAVERLGAPGPHALGSRQVAEGTHTLVSTVVYMDARWSMFSETSGFLWDMTATVNFQVQRGLQVKVKVLPALMPKEKDPRRRLRLSHDMTVEMIAKLAEEPPDGGQAVAEQGPREGPPDAGQAVAEQGSPDAGQAVAEQGSPDAGQVVAEGPRGTVPPKASQGTEVQPGPPARAKPVRLRVQVVARKKPVAATVYVRGATPQQVPLKRGARKPSLVEVAPGSHTVEVIAPGYLAQTRRVQLSEGRELPLTFNLVPAPKKKVVSVDGERLELAKPLQFVEAKAAPGRGSPAILQQVIDALVRNGAARVRIEGHTDNREGEEHARQQLSEARARAVAALLVKAGLDPARIETAGFGARQPKAPNLTPRGRELNRRVEFILLGPP